MNNGYSKFDLSPYRWNANTYTLSGHIQFYKDLIDFGSLLA